MTKQTKTRVALWQKDTSAGSGQPSLKGVIEYPDGTKMNISLWKNSYKGNAKAPTFTGEIDND
jgi:hypothetical protein